jgi:hypothetical protein
MTPIQKKSRNLSALAWRLRYAASMLGVDLLSFINFSFLTHVQPRAQAVL